MLTNNDIIDIFYDDQLNASNFNINKDDSIEYIQTLTNMFDIVYLNNKFSDLDLSKFCNDQIIDALNVYIFCKMTFTKYKRNYNLITFVLTHIKNNNYNTGDYINLHLKIINGLFYYIIRTTNMNSNENNIKNNFDFLSDKIFLKYMMFIMWNKKLCYHFLKLMMLIDNDECFEYIYDKAIDNNYEIDFFSLINHKSNEELIIGSSTHTKYYKIIKFMIDHIKDQSIKIKFIETMYDTFIKSHYYEDNELYIFLDSYVGYFTINNSKNKNICLIYKCFKPHELNHIKNKIMRCLVLTKQKTRVVYMNCINYFKLDPNMFLIDALKYINNYYITEILQIKNLLNSQNELYNLLHNIAKIKIAYANKYNKKKFSEIIKIIKMATNIKYIKLLNMNQVTSIMFTALKYKNIFIVQYLFRYFIKNTNIKIIDLFKYIRQSNFIKIFINQCKRHNINLDFNNMLHQCIMNNQLLQYLLKKNMLTNQKLKILLNIILNTNLIKQNVLNTYLLMKNINIPFDNKICKQLYDKSFYSALIIYLVHTSKQHEINYDIIKNNYKNIINCHRFDKLILHLKINRDQAHDMLSKIKNARLLKKIKFLLTNIIKLDLNVE